MFDTLMYVKRLEEAGFPREQAETQVRIMAEIIETNLVTRQDLKDLNGDLCGKMVELRSELKADMRALRSELHADMAVLRTELKNDMSRLEDRLTIKMGAIVSISLGILTAIIKLF